MSDTEKPAPDVSTEAPDAVDPAAAGDPGADAAVDPKEAMRQALERKRTASHAASNAGTPGEGKVSGGPHKAAAGKRVFRRKSGG